MPRASIERPIMLVAFLRPQPSSSWRVDTALSVRAMELVRAAKSTSRKKRIPMAAPRPMESKTLGMVMNIREGPAFRASGSPPEKANTAGMIISPAMMAMAVSKISTFWVDSSMLTLFFI